jgi:hypothetical protein
MEPSFGMREGAQGEEIGRGLGGEGKEQGRSQTT